MESKVIHRKVTGKVRGPQSTDGMGAGRRLGAADRSKSRSKFRERRWAGVGGEAFLGKLTIRSSGEAGCIICKLLISEI